MKRIRVYLLTVLLFLLSLQPAFADAALPDPVDRVSSILPVVLVIGIAVIAAILIIRRRKK